MSYLGDFTEDTDDLTFIFTTRDTSSVPTDLLGTPGLTVYRADDVIGKTTAEAYFDMEVNHDGIDGCVRVDLDLSGDAYFATGADYNVVITAGTVDGGTVIGEVVATFSIENRFMRGTDSAALAGVCTEARLQALTDWLNGGRLDLLLDAIPTTAMRGTDNAALASVCTEARLQALTDWLNGGRLDVLLDAIPTTAMRGTDSAATAVNLDLLKTQVGYEDGRIWIDTVGGAAGTTLHVNGTKENPVLTLADALTLAAAHGPGRRFHVAPGSSITLTANSDNHDFTGRRYVVALGGQSVSAAVFRNAWVTGNDDGTNSVATAYINCLMQANSLGVHQFVKCGIAVGDMVITQAGLCDWVMCRSRVAGTNTPGLDLGAAIGNSSINIRGWHGGLEFKNVGVTGTDNISLEGDGQFIINANCAGGTIAVRGNFKKTDNVVGGFVAGGGVLSEDARFSLTGVVAARMAEQTDGVSLTDILTAGMAVLCGKAVPAGSDVAFKERDGTTTKVTNTYGAADGERTGSVIA